MGHYDNISPIMSPHTVCCTVDYVYILGKICIPKHLMISQRYDTHTRIHRHTSECEKVPATKQCITLFMNCLSIIIVNIIV